jgi:hypothetical protein
MMFRVVIFSKDRAMQLHATLSSFAARCTDATDARVSVIFKASAPAYLEAYGLLRAELEERLKIEWIQEDDFKKDLLKVASIESRGNWMSFLPGRLNSSRDDYLLFMVDDNIVIGDFQLADVGRAMEKRPKALAFSLRVGKNTTYCYPNRCRQSLPSFEAVSDNILSFTWPGQEGDFGYPLEVSSSIYRIKDIESLLRRLPYSNPNRLEQGLSVSSRLFARRRPELLCFDHSVAFCAPVNKVQTVLDNRAGEDNGHSVEELNALFLKGFRIDIESLRGFVPGAAHQEIDLPLVPPSL